MPKKIIPNYCKCLVICHGKSEFIFAKSLRSNLRLKMEVYARNNGESSIQITSLMSLLSNSEFNTLKNFTTKLCTDVEIYKDPKTRIKKIKNFKVFIIMDLDEQELTEQMKKDYINRSMFKNHWLYNYIVSIYSDDNLDNVMRNLGYKIDDDNKRKCYEKIFPGTNGDRAAFEEIKSKINLSKKTNLKVFLNYISGFIE